MRIKNFLFLISPGKVIVFISYKINTLTKKKIAKREKR